MGTGGPALVRRAAVRSLTASMPPPTTSTAKDKVRTVQRIELQRRIVPPGPPGRIVPFGSNAHALTSNFVVASSCIGPGYPGGRVSLNFDLLDHDQGNSSRPATKPHGVKVAPQPGD